MATVRTSVGNLRARDVSHFGLRLARFVPSVGQDNLEARDGFLRSFGAMPELQTYRACFARWKEALTERGAALRSWGTEYRLAFGTGDETVLEVGLRLHHTYGVPVIPGSAQKGLVRRMALALGMDSVQCDSLFGQGGGEGQAAAVLFHDALWVPSDSPPLAFDTTTVHHPSYYQGSDPPTDSDEPTPIGHLTAVGEFLFAVEGPAAALGIRLLATALRDQGIGSRTSKGYGRFITGLADPVVVDRPQVVLFGAAPAVAGDAAVAAPMHTPVVAPPQVVTEDDVSVQYAPGSGQLVVALKVGKRQVPKSQVGLFADDAACDAAVLRIRKKGFILASVTYTTAAGGATIQRIVPKV